MDRLGLGRMPANTAGAFASTTNRSGNSMGIDYAKLAQEDALRNANARQSGAAAPSGQSQAEAAWQTAMGLLQKQGPYTPEVVNQLTNRRADQTAAAEAVNAEEIRNIAAARGMDPTQAVRGLQQGRQAQNVAFSGDIASQAAVQNFAAETPGRMAAADLWIRKNTIGGMQNAVNGGVMTTAFQPQQGGGYNPGAVHQQAANVSQPVGTVKPVSATGAANQPVAGMSRVDRANAAQAQWDKDTNYGRAVYGSGHQPGMGGAGATRDEQGNLLGGVGTLKPDLRAKPTTAFSAPQGGYANGRQYGAVQTFGY